MESCAHTQLRPEEALYSHLLLTFRLCASKKGDSDTAVKCLDEYWRNAPNTQSPAAKTERIIGSKYLRKSLSNYWLITKLAK